MAYPGQFHRCVLSGSLYGEETFATSFNIVPSALGELGMPAVSEGTLEAVAVEIGNQWAGVGGNMQISSSARLQSLKLNRIGTNGRYVDPVTMEYIYDGGVGGGGGSARPAPQLSLVATLETGLERGLAHRGRMFLPLPVSGIGVGTDGRITEAQAQAAADGVAALIDGVNSEYLLIGRVGVASDRNAGAFHHVTAVGVGRVLDTMRSRRASLVEERAEAPIS